MGLLDRFNGVKRPEERTPVLDRDEIAGRPEAVAGDLSEMKVPVIAVVTGSGWSCVPVTTKGGLRSS